MFPRGPMFLFLAGAVHADERETGRAAVVQHPRCRVDGGEEHIAIFILSLLGTDFL